ncbi:MAG: hypothetical protein LBT32_00435 [Peptococcaceae bacterium]|nr:hypothetical protein [Peptococcaceae bacterium]
MLTADLLICLSVLILPFFLMRELLLLWGLIFLILIGAVGIVLYGYGRLSVANDETSAEVAALREEVASVVAEPETERLETEIAEMETAEFESAVETETKAETEEIEEIDTEKIEIEAGTIIAEITAEETEETIEAVEDEMAAEAETVEELEEVEATVQTEVKEEACVEQGEVVDADVVEDDEEAADLPTLLDQGFAAKMDGRMAEAAKLFVQALKLRPAPDIAYYLLTEAYALGWEMSKDSLTKYCVEYYITLYREQLPADMIGPFAQWLQQKGLA